MTEQEWVACTGPETMLEFLRGRGSDRKFRLLACACCRQIWHLLDSWSQKAADVVEHGVDEWVGQTTLAFAAALHEDIIMTVKPYTARHIAAGIVNAMINGAAWPLAWNTVSEVRRAVKASSPQADTYKESKAQAGIVRDIFGNPFRPMTVNLAWLTPNVLVLAQAAYDNRNLPSGTLDNTRLAVLADALEENGCDQQPILDHFRHPGPHYRGWFALDMLLGKG